MAARGLASRERRKEDERERNTERERETGFKFALYPRFSRFSFSFNITQVSAVFMNVTHLRHDYDVILFICHTIYVYN